MDATRIVVLGSGFAGLWSALGAARRIDELGLGPDEMRVTVVNRLPFHDIRVRSYEADLGPSRIPLDNLLAPVGVEQVIGEVVAVDVDERQVTVSTASGRRSLDYDRLVVAVEAGSHSPTSRGSPSTPSTSTPTTGPPSSTLICVRSRIEPSDPAFGRS